MSVENATRLTSSSVTPITPEPTITDYRRLLKETFGYDDFRDGQAEVLESLSHSDVLAVMPTGGGKSMCYVLPALARGGTVVVSPLIALMQDQVESLRADGVSAAYINSQQSRDRQNKTYLDFINGRIRLLYVAPERFANERFVAGLARRGVNLLAIDEAHCISEWGHDFRPDYLGLGAIRQRLNLPRTLALTATADPHVRRDVVARLGIGEGAAQVITPVDRPNLSFSVQEVSRADHREQWLLKFLERRRGRAGIVYVGSRRNSETLAGTLNAAGIRAAAYHAGMHSHDRARIQRGFFDDGFDVIVATVAFGMGVDKPDVRFVVHYNMPGRLESYYQEAGRAGRDGEPSECVLLYSGKDVARQKRWIHDSHPDEQAVRTIWGEVVAASRATGEAYINGLRSSDGPNREGFAMAVAALRDSGLLDPNGGRLLSNDPAAPIRMTVVERHRKHAEHCLDQMVRYAESTTCRRAMILRYFGEAPPAHCAGCDNCGSASLPPTVTHDPGLLKTILDARGQLAASYRREPQEMFPSRTAQELAKYRPRTLDELLQIHGIGRTRARWFGNELLAIIADWERDHPLAAVRPELFSKRNASPGSRSPEGRRDAAQVPENDPVLQRLKAWRRDLADREGVPAFTIIWDRTLRLLASRRPQNVVQLGQISGMGESRIARFGSELLSIIRRRET